MMVVIVETMENFSVEAVDSGVGGRNDKVS